MPYEPPGKLRLWRACGIAAVLLPATFAITCLRSVELTRSASLVSSPDPGVQYSGTSRESGATVAARRSLVDNSASIAILQSRRVEPARPHLRRAVILLDGERPQPQARPNPDHGESEPDSPDRPRPRKVQRIFRTLCVRLCDGYYFPVSSAAPASRLQRDSKVCNQRCGMEGRLFIHHSPNGSVEDMVDLQGRPYRALGTAFLYRREYVASCKCQPHPWEPVSMERHRGYALALAAHNGDTDAAQQLKALQERLQELAKHSQDGAAQSLAALNAAVQPAADPTDYNRKRRTSSGAPSPPPSRPSAPGGDWAARLFNGNSNY